MTKQINYIEIFQLPNGRWAAERDSVVISPTYKTRENLMAFLDKHGLSKVVSDDRGLSKSAVPLLSKMFPPIF